MVCNSVVAICSYGNLSMTTAGLLFLLEFADTQN